MRIAYIATVTDLFGTATYEQQAARVRAICSDVGEWVEPAHRGWSLYEWLANWERILPTLDRLIVIPRADGTIGRGCWQEITDCQGRGIPVYILTGSQLAESFTLTRLPGNSYRRWARVDSRMSEGV